jgi:hypothetical protein
MGIGEGNQVSGGVEQPNFRDWLIWERFFEAVGRGPQTVGLSPRRCEALLNVNKYLRWVAENNAAALMEKKDVTRPE